MYKENQSSLTFGRVGGGEISIENVFDSKVLSAPVKRKSVHSLHSVLNNYYRNYTKTLP